MHTASLVLGILSLLGMFLGFIPCLGAYNWFNIPFAVVGLIISIIAFSSAGPTDNKTSSTVGLILCIVAIFFGIFRLMLGGGVL